MKRNSLLIAILFVVTVVGAQTVNLHMKNGEVIKYNSTEVDYIDFAESSSGPVSYTFCPDGNHPHFIDCPAELSGRAVMWGLRSQRIMATISPGARLRRRAITTGVTTSIATVHLLPATTLAGTLQVHNTMLPRRNGAVRG